MRQLKKSHGSSDDVVCPRLFRTFVRTCKSNHNPVYNASADAIILRSGRRFQYRPLPAFRGRVASLRPGAAFAQRRLRAYYRWPGNCFAGPRFVSVSPHGCELSLGERTENFEKRGYFLQVAVAPTKNMDRLEWFAEKATEIGIDRITPLLTDHCERRTVKTDG